MVVERGARPGRRPRPGAAAKRPAFARRCRSRAAPRLGGAVRGRDLPRGRALPGLPSRPLSAGCERVGRPQRHARRAALLPPGGALFHQRRPAARGDRAARPDGCSPGPKPSWAGSIRTRDVPRLLARLRATREEGFTPERLIALSAAAIARAEAAMPRMFSRPVRHPVTVEALPPRDRGLGRRRLLPPGRRRPARRLCHQPVAAAGPAADGRGDRLPRSAARAPHPGRARVAGGRLQFGLRRRLGALFRISGRRARTLQRPARSGGHDGQASLGGEPAGGRAGPAPSRLEPRAGRRLHARPHRADRRRDRRRGRPLHRDARPVLVLHARLRHDRPGAALCRAPRSAAASTCAASTTSSSAADRAASIGSMPTSCAGRIMAAAASARPFRTSSR